MNDVSNHSQSPQGNDYNSLLIALNKPPLPADFEQAVLQRTILADLPKATPPDSFEQTVLQKIKSPSSSKYVKWLLAGVGAVAFVGITWFATSERSNLVTPDSQKLVKPQSDPINKVNPNTNNSNAVIEKPTSTLPVESYTQLKNENVIRKIETPIREHNTAPDNDRSSDTRAKHSDIKVSKRLVTDSKSQKENIKSKQDAIKKHPNSRVEVDKGGKIPQRLLDEE